MGDTSSSRSSPTSDARLAVGRVVGVKGLRGGLKVELLSDRPERLQRGAGVYVEGEARPRRITGVEAGGRVPVLTLDGVASREEAQRLVGRYLEVEREPLPAGSYYWDELVGISVRDHDGADLGTLEEVFRAGENEVYRVRGPRGEIFVPALKEIVTQLDVEGRTMTVRMEVDEVR